MPSGELTEVSMGVWVDAGYGIGNETYISNRRLGRAAVNLSPKPEQVTVQQPGVVESLGYVSIEVVGQDASV